jgi:hypothetical protein
LQQRQLFAGMDQHGRHVRHIGAMAAELNQPDRAVTACVQAGGEFSQDSVRVLAGLIDQCCKVALGVEHGSTS